MRMIPVLATLCTIACVDAIRISCAYSSSAISRLGPLYTCTVRTSSVTTVPNQTISSITGAHSSGHGDVNTKIFFFTIKTVNYIPIGIGDFYPDLEGLIIQSCHLKAIEKVEIQSLVKIRALYLDNNDLKTLKSGLFDSNTALEFLQLSGNKLQSIGFDILKPLTKLTYALFYTNTCISKSATAAAELPELQAEINAKCQTEEVKKRKMNLENDLKKMLGQKDFDLCGAETSRIKLDVEKEKVENKKLSEQIEIAGAKIKKLESEGEKLKTELTEARSLLRAIDGNLNAATKNLYHFNKAKNEQPKAEVKSANDSFGEQIEKISSLTEETKLVCKDSKDKSHCEAYVFNARFAGTKIQVTDQSHSSIASTDMKKFTAISMQTLFMPRNFASNFPKLNEMSVVNSGLFEIDFNVFEGMLELRILNLTQNKLHEIKAGTFKDQTDLSKLDLSFNKIEIIHQDAFGGPTRLETLLLNDNLLLRIDGRTFELLNSLKVLTLNNNILKYISPTLLSSFDKLTSADLTNNKCVDMSFPTSSLDKIETHLTENCVAPIDFNCNFRVIKNLADGSNSYMCSPQNLKIFNPKTRISSLKGKNMNGYGFSDVQTLMISGQTTEFMPYEIAKTFTKLERIVVEKSKLAKLQSKDFEGLKSLKTIVIIGNKINSIHPSTFNDVPQLDHLDLSSNGIKELPSQVFASLTKLTTLKMSNNGIEQLSADILARKTQIMNFLFDSNQLESIDQKLLRMLKLATVIDFSNNVCINAKFVEGDNESKTMEEFYGSVGFKCTVDD